MHVHAVGPGGRSARPVARSRRSHHAWRRCSRCRGAGRCTLRALDVDVLVNNAGTIGDLQPAQSSNTAVADALIDINLRVAVHSTMAVLPGMVQRNRGHVVFTGSIAGTRPTANSAIVLRNQGRPQRFADGLRMDLHGTRRSHHRPCPRTGGDTTCTTPRSGGHDRRGRPPVLRRDVPATGGRGRGRRDGRDDADACRRDPDRGRSRPARSSVAAPLREPTSIPHRGLVP